MEGGVSDGQNGGAGRFPAFQRAMGLGGVTQREGLPDLNLHFTRQDEVEQFGSRLLQFVARGDVVEQGRASQEQRALLR